MKQITMLAMPGTQAISVTGALDVFHAANAVAALADDSRDAPVFRTCLATWDGKPIRCSSGFEIMPEKALQNCPENDLILISSIPNDHLGDPVDADLAEWLISQYESGCTLGGICTGVFRLAGTGLLNGRPATTHWDQALRFSEMFPEVCLEPGKMVTESDRLICAGGASAGMDLALWLVEKQLGEDVARKTAKQMVVEMARSSQGLYSEFTSPKSHGQDAVLDIQEWIEDNFEQRFSYDELALGHAISRRTLERKFKNATGLTPLGYQHHIRVEACKKLLETTTRRFEEITAMVGYEDTSSFRKIFQKLAGSTPGDYRRKFGRAED